MGGMIKHVFWIAPLGIIILVITWSLTRESQVEMKVQDAAYERDWNEGMVTFAKTKKDRQRLEQRAVAAQSRYSSAMVEQAEKSQEMKQHEGSINQAVKDLDSELANGRQIK
ncbi:hypothetical protein [Trichlorobacter lovleyi]|uniref:hypothetical protein n=1 Tax=Trichlorobacter lovleyi TaxID=313985 RepID=UPI00248155EE|nr:hypothetical protein [Trichlorobacter lovleyi]